MTNHPTQSILISFYLSKSDLLNTTSYFLNKFIKKNIKQRHPQTSENVKGTLFFPPFQFRVLKIISLSSFEAFEPPDYSALKSKR